MVKKPISRRSIPGRKKAVLSRPLKKRRRIVPRPKLRSTSAAVIRTAHGPSVVRQAIRHIGEIFSQRDSSHFVHQIFTECGLAYPHTVSRYFPPSSYFKRVNTPLAGDIVLYAEHMGIYAQNNKIILADPASQQVLVSTISSFLNLVGYYRWYQDLKK
jgi:hypothetical protein